MKKTYTRIKVFALLLSLVAVNMSAQLGGVYTINSASPTAGSNYQTFTAFKNALVASGISGTVVVNVAPSSGPYNEQVEFPNIVGTSASNTITINGNGCTMSFAGTSGSPWTISLGGIDYMSVYNMNFFGTDGTYALVGHIWNDANNNQFVNCTFNAPVNGTSSLQCPFSVSGSGTSATSSGNSGNNNAAINCTMNWGYYGIAMYGLTGSPYNTNNQIIGCTINDAYVYSCYNVYQRQLVYRNNTIQRLNRNAVTTTYGILFTTGTYQTLCEGNRIQRMFQNAPGASVTGYYLYVAASSASGFEGIFRNNLIQVDKCVGSAYCIYHPGYTYNNFYHNTVSVDGQTDAGSLTVYGTYFYGTFSNFKNNNISITRTGAGTNYGIYIASTISAGFSNGNNVYVNTPSGTNYFGYHYSWGAMATLATWTTNTGLDLNSFSTNPLFVNPNNYDFMPGSYVMNDGGQALGVANDILGASRSLATPDPGAWEYFNTPCAGNPSANSVITPTLIVCPNSGVNVYMANSYTTSGNTYQWQISNVSAVGPFTTIPTGTNSALNHTVGSQVLWYSAIVTCTNGNNSTTAISGSVNVAGTTTNTIPYFEGFEGISGQGKLPNCSWTANNMNTTCFTYTSIQTQNRVPYQGNNFASFYYSPAANNYFWTNGIWMDAGVTYSVSMWYMTEYYTYPTYQLNILVGPNQSTLNAQTVYSSGGSGSAASPAYKSVSATYSVATSGLYYVGINGNSNGTCCGYYLSWDNLKIEVPCSLNPVNIAVNANASTICAGQSVNLTASGATSYQWSNGATTNAITVSPANTTIYSVVGTNATSGCTANATQAINVNPSPAVGVFAPNTSVCLGSSVILTAFGASSYTWNTNATTNAISVSPSSSTSYTVIGSNSFGCTAQASQAITVNALPSVQIQSSAAGDLACMTDVTTLNYSGTGAVTFQWISGNGVLLGNPVNVSPQSTTTYTLIGTSAQGCTASAVYELNVTECTGLNQASASLNNISVYPNPNNGTFSIEWKNGAAKTAEVSDISGRVVYTAASELDVMSINLNGFANGVYFVKVQSGEKSELIRVVKQ
ncbi:MAG TPA: T9SS type A sorting domain-containing protein [Bacteroidia bacterium]|nr:T9SS type A sorting domain-containing protein [Bacteroidia bacterium]